MADGNRFNVIARRTDAMRRLSDGYRRELIDASLNVIGFERFSPFAAKVRRNEIDLAVSITNPRIA